MSNTENSCFPFLPETLPSLTSRSHFLLDLLLHHWMPPLSLLCWIHILGCPKAQILSFLSMYAFSMDLLQFHDSQINIAMPTSPLSSKLTHSTFYPTSAFEYIIITSHDTIQNSTLDSQAIYFFSIPLSTK